MYDYHGLKNSQRAVYEAIIRLTAEGQRISYTVISDLTGYSRPTVWTAIRGLREAGYISSDGYKLKPEYEEEIMAQLFKSLANIVTMSGAERWERLIMALTANRIYEDAQKLKKLSRKRDGDLRHRVEEFLEETGACRLTSVWSLDEAAEIRARLDALLEEFK